MKKLIALLFVSSLITVTTIAQEISADQSLRKALPLISKKGYATQVREAEEFTLQHTEKSLSKDKTLYYVFRNNRKGGFLIAGADKRSNTILGYTENGTYEQALEIPAFRAWLSNCQSAMLRLSDNNDDEEESSIIQEDVPDQIVYNADSTTFFTIPGRCYTLDASLPASVKPLLGEISWNQNKPYNNMCPDVPGKNAKCATGCVATATAQVMKYHEWPKQGTGYNKYTSEGVFKGELEADFSQSVYDWDNMLNSYKEGVEYTEAQANAVAKLMSDIGIAEHMAYGEASGTEHYRTTYALATHFGYNKGMQWVNREYFNYVEWHNMLKKELAEGRPIIIGGDNSYQNAGHEFVLDGYNDDNRYHVNWGWGGLSDGYYDINYLDPKNQGIGGSDNGYPSGQEININCYPDKDGTSVAHPYLVVKYEPDFENDSITFSIRNQGLATYVGDIGLVALLDDQIIGGLYTEITESDSLLFSHSMPFKFAFSDLEIPTDKLYEGAIIKIYPAYSDENGIRVPQSKVSFQSYVLFQYNSGEFTEKLKIRENARPVCDTIKVLRNYAGFKVKAKAVITNEENHASFDRVVIMRIKDENGDLIAQGRNFAFMEPGTTMELDFLCELEKGKTFVAGKTYELYLAFASHGYYKVIPNSKTTITMQDPGGDPEMYYYGFALDKTVAAQGEEINVTFTAANLGGFYNELFYFLIFKDGAQYSTTCATKEMDLPTGSTTVSIPVAFNFEEGGYFCQVRTKHGDTWTKLTDEGLTFTISNSSAIGSVTVDPAVGTEQYYDLQGRRVTVPTKGIFIQNGKKVIY